VELSFDKGNRQLEMNVVTAFFIVQMLISKSTSVIGDMIKENYFSRSFNHNLYLIPLEFRPQSI